MEVVSAIVIVPLIVGITQVLKLAFLDSYSRWAPALDVLLGIVLSFGLNSSQHLGLDWFSVFVNGLEYGLSAAGLYSSVQTVTKGPTVLRSSDYLKG